MAALMAAMVALGSTVMIFAGVVLFGVGFGVIENATRRLRCWVGRFSRGVRP